MSKFGNIGSQQSSNVWYLKRYLQIFFSIPHSCSSYSSFMVSAWASLLLLGSMSGMSPNLCFFCTIGAPSLLCPIPCDLMWRIQGHGRHCCCLPWISSVQDISAYIYSPFFCPPLCMPFFLGQKSICHQSWGSSSVLHFKECYWKRESSLKRRRRWISPKNVCCLRTMIELVLSYALFSHSIPATKKWASNKCLFSICRTWQINMYDSSAFFFSCVAGNAVEFLFSISALNLILAPTFVFCS